MTRLIGPELLRADHALEGFDCGDGTLNDWLARRAVRNQAAGSSRTWVVTNGERVIGYYSSSAAAILRSESPRRAVRNQPDPLPALLLGRLAVDIEHQGRGLGRALLQHFVVKAAEVARITGVRVLLVHATDSNAAAFYRHHGFRPSPLDNLTLMLLTIDIEDWARRP